MARQQVTFRKQFALWRAHGQRCQYCKEPLIFKDIWVEHILPYKLKKTDTELKRILSEYGLPDNFELDDYENWLPTHHHCNRDKGGRIPDKSEALHFIGIAKAKAIKARLEEEKCDRNLTKNKLLGKLAIGIQRKLITREELSKFLDGFSHAWYHLAQKSFQEMVVTFSLNVCALVERSVLKPNVPRDYASLCDWLEKVLIKDIASIVSSQFYYPEASARDGEMLSVRLAFLNLDLDELEGFKSSWWTITDISYHSDIYDEEYWFKEKDLNESD